MAYLLVGCLDRTAQPSPARVDCPRRGGVLAPCRSEPVGAADHPGGRSATPGSQDSTRAVTTNASRANCAKAGILFLTILGWPAKRGSFLEVLLDGLLGRLGRAGNGPLAGSLP